MPENLDNVLPRVAPPTQAHRFKNRLQLMMPGDVIILRLDQLPSEAAMRQIGHRLGYKMRKIYLPEFGKMVVARVK